MGGEKRGREGEGSLGRGGYETPPLQAPLIHISGYAPVNQISVSLVLFSLCMKSCVDQFLN